LWLLPWLDRQTDLGTALLVSSRSPVNCVAGDDISMWESLGGIKICLEMFRSAGTEVCVAVFERKWFPKV